MQVPKTLSLDYPTVRMLEMIALDHGENLSEVVRRLISEEWDRIGYSNPPQEPEWHGEGVS